MRVLLIWEEIPENTKFFVLDNPTSSDLDHLSGANETIINYSENDDTLWLNSAIGDPRYTESIEGASKWFGRDIPVADLPKAGAFDQVFWSGFAL